MKWLWGLGLVLGSAVVWAVLLWPARYFLVPFPFGLFTSLAAVGLPAFFAAPLAYRWRLPLPPAWALAGYSLGSGLATALLLTGTPSPGDRVQVALAHAGSLTLLLPYQTGLLPAWGNLLWVAAVLIMAYYGLETYLGRGPVPREPKK